MNGELQARLVRMKGQAEAPQPFAEHFHHTPSVVLAFEIDDEVVAVADQGCPAPQSRLHLGLEPRVEHVVQIDVREERREHRPQGGADFGTSKLLPVEHPTCKHLPMSRKSDPSPTRVWSSSTSAVRSTLSKQDTMSASRIQFSSPRWTIRSRVRTASWVLRPGRKPYEQSKESRS